MEIVNSWVDGEDHVRKPRPRSDGEDDDQPRHDSSNRRDRCKKRKDRGYDDTNMIAVGYSDSPCTIEFGISVAHQLFMHHKNMVGLAASYWVDQL
jgi:hypothetical protein